MYIRNDSLPIGYIWLFTGSIITLIICGIVFIYSASSVYALERLGCAHYYAKKHIIGLILGISSFIFTFFLPIDFIKKVTPYCFLLSLCLTALTMLSFFSHTVHGSSRWLKIGSFTFQPSELLKFAFILYLAYFFAKKAENKATLAAVYIPFLCILGITSFVLLIQPDFGMTITLCATGILLAFIAGVRAKHLATTLALLMPIILFLIYLKPYRIKRILTFLNPWADPQGAGFQIIQSFIAIGAGELWGIGIGQSKQKFFYLPMQHTDFIFAIIAEETGFIGSVLVITLFMIFLYAGLQLALSKRDPFARYTICGFVILLSLQALINIAVATGLVPTKGIGLPFISYGNSSLVSTLAMLGVVLRMIKEPLHALDARYPRYPRYL